MEKVEMVKTVQAKIPFCSLVQAYNLCKHCNWDLNLVLRQAQAEKIASTRLVNERGELWAIINKERQKCNSPLNSFLLDQALVMAKGNLYKAKKIYYFLEKKGKKR